MIDPLGPAHRVALVTRDLYLVMAIGLAICFLPALGCFERLHEQLRAAPQWPTIVMASAAGLLVLSIAKAITIAFHPFLYFRF
jgi:hypothetical protein